MYHAIYICDIAWDVACDIHMYYIQRRTDDVLDTPCGYVIDDYIMCCMQHVIYRVLYSTSLSEAVAPFGHLRIYRFDQHGPRLARDIRLKLQVDRQI